MRFFTFYSVHFHTSHNTEKVSKRNSNQLFHCIYVFSFPQFKISLVSNTVIKILCINRECKKIMEENTFLLCYKKPLLLVLFPLTDDYLCLDFMLNIYPPFMGTAECLRFLLPAGSLKMFLCIMHGVR